MHDQKTRLQQALGGRYLVEGRLGEGGNATVYLATDRKLGRDVALKVLRPELAVGVGAERFLREIRVVAGLTHPDILPLHDSGEADGLLFFTMPYVRGPSLRDRLERERQLPVEEVVRLGVSLAGALAHAHQAGIVHRDVKPGNILFEDDRPVLADFGIASLVDTSEDAHLTRTGSSVGTAAYMSPEQATGDAVVDPRCDVYALACVLYESLTGDPPFTGSTAQAILGRKLTEPPPPIRSVRPTVPEALEAALLRALSPIAADRFPTMEAFRQALEGAGTARAGSRTGRGWSRPRWLVGVGATVLAMVALLLVARPGAAGIDFAARDWLLVTDVENHTGDEVFDRTLQHALTVAVDQSQYVNVFPRNRVAEVFARMRRDVEEGVPLEVALEMAEREGIRAVLHLAIAGVDDRYVLTAQLFDPVTGASVLSRQTDAEGRDAVLPALDRLARAVREGLGESLEQIEERAVPLPSATTSSLDALRLYVQGQQAWSAGQAEAARTFWSGAVALDSMFAWAHASHGLATRWLQGSAAAEPHFDRALSLLDRVTEKERLWIRGLVGEGADALEAYQAYVAQYPDDRDGWYNLGNTLRNNQRHDESLDAYARAIVIDSTFSWAHFNLGTQYDRLGRFDEAMASFRSALRFDSTLATTWRGDINRIPGFVMLKVGDTVAARRHFEHLLALEPMGRANGLRSLALLEMYRGAHTRALELWDEAIFLTQQEGTSDSELRNRLYAVRALRSLGRVDDTLDELAQARRFIDADDPAAAYAVPYVQAHAAIGSLDEARRVVGVLVERGAMAGRARALVEVARGEIALAEGAWADAVEALEAAVRLDRTGVTLDAFARALEAAGRLERAADVYRELIDLRPLGLEPQDAWVLAHLRLGRVLTALGDDERARPHLERFLELWGEGDPGLQGVAEARALLAGERPTGATPGARASPPDPSRR